MPTFEYQAVGSDGRAVSGVLVGTSLDQALSELGAKGMQVTRIGIAAHANDPLAGRHIEPVVSKPTEAAQAEMPGKDVQSDNPYATPSIAQERLSSASIMRERTYAETSIWGPLAGQVALTHLLFFFRQLATMLSAGVPFVQSLDTLAGQARDAKMASVIRELKTHVEAGRPISFGMQRYPEVFSPVMLSLVRAGERSGMLDESLEIVADYLEREIKLRGIYRRVTFFPKLELLMSVLIIVAANALIGSLNPNAKKLWSPLTDPKVWIYLGPLIILVFLFLRVGLANPRIKYNWDLIASKVPHLGRTLREFSMAKFGRAFGALYRAGVPVNEAMRLGADACGNEVLRARMYPATEVLQQGQGIAETFRQSQAFSPIVMDMVATGETTGNMDQMLTKMADYYEDEGETRMTQFAYTMGILLALLVCIYIGYVIITFYMDYGMQYQQMTG